MKNPMQPIGPDESGVIRFKRNAIVRKLVDFASTRGYGLNEIACDDFTQDDRVQLAQLIGYSLSGFGELDYVDNESYEAACHMANGGSEERSRNQYLRETLASVKDTLRPLVAELYRKHPKDLE